MSKSYCFTVLAILPPIVKAREDRNLKNVKNDFVFEKHFKNKTQKPYFNFNAEVITADFPNYFILKNLRLIE